jgi:hypothetical protein
MLVIAFRVGVAITSWQLLFTHVKNLRTSENALTSTSNPLVTVNAWLPSFLVRRECVSPSARSKATRCSEQDSAAPSGVVNIAITYDFGLQQSPETAESLWYHKGGRRAEGVTGGILRWAGLS